MAKLSVEQQQRRLKLKSEELRIRVQQQDSKKKLSDVRQQLRGIGGRVR